MTYFIRFWTLRLPKRALITIREVLILSKPFNWAATIQEGFTKHPWLPVMNSPIFWAKSGHFSATLLSNDEFVVGEVPSTNIGVAAKVSELVEFHTAILGVTGTGKTELALDIVREAEERDVKVFCVDFTGEYREQLADLLPIFPAPSEKATDDLATKLFDAETGAYGAGAEKKKLDEALKAMRAGIQTQINEFLKIQLNRFGNLRACRDCQFQSNPASH